MPSSHERDVRPVVQLQVADESSRQALAKIVDAEFQLADDDVDDDETAVVIIDAATAADKTSLKDLHDSPALILLEDESISAPALEADGYIQQPLQSRAVLATLRAASLARSAAKALRECDDIIDHFSESFVAVDADWRVRQMNKAAEQFLDMRREEAFGKDAWSLFPRIARSRHAGELRRAMTLREPFTGEMRSAEYGWTETIVVPLNDGGLGIYFRSSCKMKEAQQAAVMSERRLRLFLEHATDYALILMDARGRVEQWLGATEAITGWTGEEMRGRTVSVLFTEEDRAAKVPARELSIAIQRGRAPDNRWHQRKDGRRFFAEGVTTAFTDESGAIRGFGKVFRDATKRHLADQRLRENREQLELIVNSVADGIYTIDAQGRCTLMNPSGASMLGYEAEDLIGQPLHELIHHHRADGRLYPKDECAIVRAVARSESVWVEDEVFWRKDGSAVAVRYAVRPMGERHSNGGAVVTFTDITERIREQRALEDNESQMRLVMDAVPQKIFTATPRGEMIYVNLSWLEYAGRSLEQLRGHGWRDLLHPDEAEAVLKEWQESFKRGNALQLEHRLRDRHGNYRWQLSRAMPVRRSGGGPSMWVGSNTDIHDLKTAEVRLANKLQSEQRRAALLMDLADASRAVNTVMSVEGVADILADQARRILDVQWAAVNLLPGGTHLPAVRATASGEGAVDAGAGILDLSTIIEMCADNRVVHLNADELARHPVWLRAGGREGMELPNGCLIAPLVGHRAQHLGFVKVFHRPGEEFDDEDDAIIAQLAAIAAVGIENASLYDSLREQDRHKDEFLATLAHELRNPLAPLRTGLDLLSREHQNDEAMTMMGMMQRQLGHLVRLVDDLMDVSRVSRGKVELRRSRVAVSTIIDSAVEVNQPQIDSVNQTLTVEYPEEEIYLYGDTTRLSQVISNLLNNASKYTPSGGHITLRVRPDGARVHIDVSDSGIGIEPDMLPRVFDLFAQAAPGRNESQGGLGIGLSLVKQLVEMHGGSVSADSAGPGRGSTFTVCLPIAPEQDASGTEQQGRSFTPDLGGKRVLVVDDNRDAAEILAMLLEANGHSTALAHDGASALDMARRFDPDLVLLDIGLPDMDGYAVARAMRSDPALQHFVIIALTGWGSEEDRRRSREAGFDLHLTKPVSAETLSSALERFFPAQGVG